jgi:hypothetical protein
VPRRDRILPKEVRWRGSKCVSRVLAPLVPDGAAPRTQESHPSTLDGLGAHNERCNFHFPLGNHLTSGPSTATTRAPSVSGVIGWVLVSSTQSTSKRRGMHIGSMALCAPQDPPPLRPHRRSAGDDCVATTVPAAAAM